MGWSNTIKSVAGRLSGGAATGRRTTGGRGVSATGRGGARRPAGAGGAGGMLRKFLKRR